MNMVGKGADEEDLGEPCIAPASVVGHSDEVDEYPHGKTEKNCIAFRVNFTVLRVMADQDISTESKNNHNMKLITSQNMLTKTERRVLKTRYKRKGNR